MELNKVWQQGWKDDKPDPSVPAEKSSSKLKLNHGDCTTTWGFASDKFSLNANAKLYEADGYKSTVTAGCEAKPAKPEYKGTGEVTLSTPDLGGAKFGLNVSITAFVAKI